MKKIKNEVGAFETFAYGICPLAAVGTTICSSYLSTFWTNVVGIPIAVVGVILLGARIFDGITDVVVGELIDKTNTRFGKAKPWLLAGQIGVLLSTLLLFLVPQMSMQGRTVYSTVFYILNVCIFGTMASVAAPTLVNLMTMNPQKRYQLGSMNFVVMFGVSMVASFLINLVEPLGGGQKGWINIVLLCSVIAVICIMICWNGIHERTGQKIEKKKDKIEAVEVVKAIVGNKYYIYVTGMYFFTNVSSGVVAAVTVYYALYILHSTAAFTVLMVASYLPCMAGTALAPWLSKRFGISRLVVGGNIITAAAYLAMLIAPENLMMLTVFTAIGSFANGPACAVLSPYCAMAADYGEYKTGVSRPGIYSGAASMGTKIGMGIGGAVAAGILAAAGFDGMAEVQTGAALTAIIFCYVVTPAAVMVINTFLCIPFFRLEKEHEKIIAANLERRKQSEAE